MSGAIDFLGPVFMIEENPTSQQNYTIIVAGGSGSRMQSVIPKQFLLLGGKPVIMHTINAFYISDTCPSIIVVLPADYHDYWASLCAEYQFNVPHQLVSGGQTRFHSVKNALSLIDSAGLVAIHDAVRPLISTRVIDASFAHASLHGNAVVAVPSRDSVRRVTGQTSEALNRDEIYLVQTPQTFQYTQLKNAYDQAYRGTFTDDASVVEQTGVNINLIAGNTNNIKITFAEDIAIAEMLLK